MDVLHRVKHLLSVGLFVKAGISLARCNALFCTGTTYGPRIQAFFECSKKNHPLYHNWQTYTAAHSEWVQQNTQALAAERTRQSELRKRETEARKRELAWWTSLDGQQFERETADLHRELGYEVTLTPYSADGGIDMIVHNGAKRIIVQCKAHRTYISAGVVRELYGTMVHDNAYEGWVVITSDFYSGARTFAHGKPIKLITITELLNRKQATDTGIGPESGKSAGAIESVTDEHIEHNETSG